METLPHGGPAVVGANWYRFRAGEHIHHPHVASVSFVWVVQGSGVLTSRGESFPLTVNTIVRLPWRHDVDYRPDPRSPFHLGTLHLVPWHDAAVPVTARVAHEADDPLLGAGFRRDASPVDPSPSHERPMLLSSLSTTGRNVIALASYCVERFLTSPFGEAGLRASGVLIAEESATWATAQALAEAGHGGSMAAPGAPVALVWMIDYIAADVEHPLSVAAIAAAGGCSVATAERLFARYTGLSVQAWVRRRRLEEAARLLRTSGLRVNEVARRVGFSDPLYFSRVFSAAYSVPPSRYASGQLRP